MGEVYRARDPKLHRDIAIKVLPEAVATDPERLAQFEREARARALAHEAGIIHRVLKPADIKVKDDGLVKVLDFGLAKALAPDSAHAAADAMNSPTISAHATSRGVILGTAAYMAPEQARGKAVDKRADIWAFGVVLHEMLTGKRLFAADEMSDTLAHVLTREPDWTALWQCRSRRRPPSTSSTSRTSCSRGGISSRPTYAITQLRRHQGRPTVLPDAPVRGPADPGDAAIL